MKEMLELIVRALVDHPDEVEIAELPGEAETLYELKVARVDLGKVIGKQGRTVRAIRTLVASAGVKQRKRFVFEIVE